jgi:hypothetical protein
LEPENMTRKDFELIARAVRGLDCFSYQYDGADMPSARFQAATAMADALGSTNPAFDRARFLTACGVQS